MTAQQKVSELVPGPVMNALVTIAQGWEFTWRRDKTAIYLDGIVEYQPSDHNKAQAFELMDAFDLTVGPYYKGGALAIYDNGDIAKHAYTGKDRKEAICKVVLASVYGDTIPAEIMEKVL